MVKQIIVDKNDKVIGAKERSDITIEDIYRVSSLYIINSKGEVLLGKRALTKKKHPGLWTFPVNGTVDEGETYEENIIKETEEEIGVIITKQDIITGPKIFRRDKIASRFIQIYILYKDLDLDRIKFDPSEIAQLKWYTKDEMFKDVKKNPDKYIGGALDVLNCIYNFLDK